MSKVHVAILKAGIERAQAVRHGRAELESAVTQLAADLRVAGLGQGTRAALRRNQDANDDTFMPEAAFKDIPGPDLVRHANAAYIASLTEAQGQLRFGRADDQLLAVLQRQLTEVRRFVAMPVYVGVVGCVA